VVEDTQANITELRLRLARGGYTPLPLYGKSPPIFGKNNKRGGLTDWGKLDGVTREQLELWARVWPDAVNTGVLTRSMPTLDLDLLGEEAAEACEAHVLEHYEEAGPIMVRIGKAPKRAIPFRTSEPFDKIVANVIAPNGKAEKIEFLANGQQVVVDGIHPDTQRPYRWRGGEPGQIKLEELPYIREEEAQRLVDELAGILVKDFGYKRGPERPRSRMRFTPRGNGGFTVEVGGGPDDWGYLVENIYRGREWHDSLRDLAAKLVASGMVGAAAVNLLRGEMNRSAAPHDARWQERYDEIPRLVESAEEKFRAHEDEDEQPRTPWTVPVLTWRDPATIPRRKFLYGHYYARGFVSATIADGGMGKSLLKIVEFLSCATGLSLLGIVPTARVRVLYWNGDDPYVEVERRIHAACQHYRIDLKQLLEERWLYIGTRDNQPLCIAGRTGTVDRDTVADICAFIKENEIGLACFDPLKSVHRVPENSNDDMDIIGSIFNTIAERTDTAVGLDHHIRKMAFGQAEITTADARGAGALINKVRLSRVLNSMTATLATQARVGEDDRRRYFRADGGKANVAPPTKATWYKIVSVPCANGEDTPTVAAWAYPNAFDIVTVEHMHKVRAMAAAGSYRKDSRSEDWIGRAVAEVLDLDLNDEADLKQVKNILKIWFANGVLDAKPRKDETRHERNYVVPGNWADDE
jgi:AAA domain/Bifunctional DNA primase/polymerase, N-terminal